LSRPPSAPSAPSSRPKYESSFRVKEEDGDLIISTTEKQLELERRAPTCGIKTLPNEIPIIVVGAGVSASAFVEHARMNGCAAPITMISDDSNPPYDRTRLSKEPGMEAKELRFRGDDYYKENHIDIMLNTKVTAVDTTRRNVTLSTGEQLPYSKLVLALGGKPKKLPIPGADLK
ncbi:hypothetical protein TELCIR_15788, partial [Teladorsagia circumcincta]